MKKLIYFMLLLPLLVAMKCEKDEPTTEDPQPAITIKGDWNVIEVRAQVLENGASIYDTLFIAPFDEDTELFNDLSFDNDSVRITLNGEVEQIRFQYSYTNTQVTVVEEGDSLVLFSNVNFSDQNLSFDLEEPIVGEPGRTRLYSYTALKIRMAE